MAVRRCGWMSTARRDFSRRPGELRPEVCRLLEAGWRVEGVDLFEQGEFLSDGQPITQTRRVKNPREAGCFTFGYNSALFAQRVHCRMNGTSSAFAHPTRRMQ